MSKLTDYIDTLPEDANVPRAIVEFIGDALDRLEN